MVRNFTNKLFPVYPAAFRSEYPFDEAVVRLRSSVTKSNMLWGRSFRPSPFDSVPGRVNEYAFGHVRADDVQLQWLDRRFANAYKPIFRGAFKRHARSVVLAGSFEVHPFTKIFMTVWFGLGVIWTLLALFTLAMVFVRPYVLVFPLGGICALIAGYWFTQYCWRISRRDIEHLSHVITAALNPLAQRGALDCEVDKTFQV